MAISLAKSKLVYNFLIRKGVIKVFKLLLPIYTYDSVYNSVYNSTYDSCPRLLLRSPPSPSTLVSLSLPLFLPLLLLFPLALLLLPCISGSLQSSLLCAFCSAAFLEFCTLPGDLVFGESPGRLRLPEGLDGNIGGREEMGEEVLISLRGDQGGLLTSICKQLVIHQNYNITLTTLQSFFNESISLSYSSSLIASIKVLIFLSFSLTSFCCSVAYYLLCNSFKVVGVFKIVSDLNSVYSLNSINAFKLAYTFLRLRSLSAARRS